MRRLTVWDHVRRFLKLDDLFICKARSIVHDLHRIGRLANGTRASGGLSDLATVNVHFDGMIANGAAEEG